MVEVQERALELWQAVVLGLVEGVTEYLPVSSTGHLVLVEGALGLRGEAGSETRAALDAMSIVVQGGAILAVAMLYWPRCVQMLRGLLGRDRGGMRLLVNLVIAFLPAAVVGKLASEWIKANLFHAWHVAGAMLVGGVYMLVIEALRARGWFAPREIEAGAAGGAPGNADQSLDAVTPAKALFIGLMQVVAMWPGTSRSMMTITAGEMAGLRPAAAAEFSFLLGLPTLGAATLYSLYKNLSAPAGLESGVAHGNMFQVLGTWPVVVALVVSTISAALAVKWLVTFLNRHGLAAFGWYRITFGVLLLVLIGTGYLRF